MITNGFCILQISRMTYKRQNLNVTASIASSYYDWQSDQEVVYCKDDSLGTNEPIRTIYSELEPSTRIENNNIRMQHAQYHNINSKRKELNIQSSENISIYNSKHVLQTEYKINAENLSNLENKPKPKKRLHKQNKSKSENKLNHSPIYSNSPQPKNKKRFKNRIYSQIKFFPKNSPIEHKIPHPKPRSHTQDNSLQNNSPLTHSEFRHTDTHPQYNPRSQNRSHLKNSPSLQDQTNIRNKTTPQHKPYSHHSHRTPNSHTRYTPKVKYHKETSYIHKQDNRSIQSNQDIVRSVENTPIKTAYITTTPIATPPTPLWPSPVSEFAFGKCSKGEYRYFRSPSMPEPLVKYPNSIISSPTKNNPGFYTLSYYIVSFY